MKTLHLVGHNHKWNLDSHFQNGIGEGFIFCSYSFGKDFDEKPKISGYNMSDIIPISKIDLQYFGKKESGDIENGNFKSYSFHPSNFDGDSSTNEYMLNSIKEAVKYQIRKGFNDIIIPNHYENENVDELIGLIKNVNKWLGKNKDNNYRYFMTIPFTNHTIIDSVKVENILYALTEGNINFDGYYIVCESKPDIKQKISTDIKYLKNLSRVFYILKKQKFITLYAYANWDALVFLSICDIDFISIASYENLRNFKINRFLSTEDGGPSKGWYFSEKLLNFVKAQFIELIREKGCIPLIENDRNIFSEIILDTNFPWNNHKPEVHKNYLISVNKQLYQLAAEKDLSKRKGLLLQKIDNGIKAYEELENNKIYLQEDSKNYHLAIWKSFLMSR
jgi:hypothetical protein